MFTTYIIYSQALRKYYTGYTSQSAEERLTYHNKKHQGFTSRAKDWVVVYSQSFPTRAEALLQERRIKKRGAVRFLDR
ncbi:GIY-YIG nuclease family protein [Portibacter marinus]|uniref:GIY-YIG nuclease family protein n=1 Tax=Portibacter marinus TaxID=2898660 RepID=UPI001F3C7663|nr:GIY-YIG nuclease family protein [Portibacter marinus]